MNWGEGLAVFAAGAFCGGLLVDYFASRRRARKEAAGIEARMQRLAQRVQAVETSGPVDFDRAVEIGGSLVLPAGCEPPLKERDNPIPVGARCPACDGEGWLPDRLGSVCTLCEGTGRARDLGLSRPAPL